MARRRSLKRGTPVTSNGVLRYEVLSADSANNKWYNIAPKAAYDATLAMTAGDWPDFDGVGDFGHTGTLNSKPITEDMTDYTLEAWVNFDAITAGDRVIFMSNATFQDAISLLVDNGSDQLWARVRNSTSTASVNVYGATAITTGSWNHLVMSADSTSGMCIVYLNGHPDGGGPYTAPLAGDYGCFICSAWYPPSGNNGGQIVNGKCNNVRLYNKALSFDEVARNYYAGKAVHT
tara:strand:+ start:5344 stop:6045 length:702 start_codon:yes stop_codon:yes gene_type:complete